MEDYAIRAATLADLDALPDIYNCAVLERSQIGSGQN
jgi:hypothetical protein